LAALTGKCGKFPQPAELTDNDAKTPAIRRVGRRLNAGFVIGVSRIRPFPRGAAGPEWRERTMVADTRGMPVTKITLSTAMRARDVSRPHEEHLAEAAVRENTVREDAAARRAEVPPPKPKPAPSPAPPPAKPSPAEPAPTRRRRRRGR
jgi:hypothetical protein